LKNITFALLLAAAFGAGCSYTRSPSSPAAPTQVVAVEDHPVNPVVYPSTGPEVVAYVAAAYPERLAAGVGHDQRVENMKFLRDRIIEVGQCGGMDLGQNLKRGGPDISIDFLAWRTGGEDIGVDLGVDYDNDSHPLQLVWNIAGAGATYSAYPRPSC
jgi:hypothetical protein